MAADESETKYRELRGVIAKVVSAIAIIFCVYHVLYITGLFARIKIFIDTPMHLAMHLGPILVLVFLLLPITEKARRQKLPWYDVLLGLLGLRHRVIHSRRRL